jgi:hypothetical protein
MSGQLRPCLESYLQTLRGWSKAAAKRKQSITVPSQIAQDSTWDCLLSGQYTGQYPVLRQL